MHPAIAEASQRRFEELSKRGDRWIVYEASQLIEAGRHRDMDVVVLVVADDALRLERLLARGMSEDAAQQRIAAQGPQDAKRPYADYVIENSGTRKETEQGVAELWQTLCQRFSNL